MLRLSILALTMVLLHPPILSAKESKEGQCTILNTTDHPIVIGLYRPSEDGIEEQLVKVASKTQVDKIPVHLVADAQFVVAYEASLGDSGVSRSKPVFILGHTVLKYIKKKNESSLPDVVIHYRGGSSIHRSRPGPFNIALYLPDAESEAKRVLRDANHTSKLIETPLAQQSYSEAAK